MIIQFECPDCHKTLRVKEQYAGKRAKCVHCGQPVWIPRKQEAGGELVVDRSAPRRRYEAAPSADTFEVTCEACGTAIRVARQDSGMRIQCTNDECLGMILATPPDERKKGRGAKSDDRDLPTSAAAPRAADEISEKIANYIRSGYTMLYLVTWEEDRWGSKLSDLALAAGRGLVLWSATEGARPPLSDEQSAIDPGAFLDQIGLYPAEHVFLVRDFHSYLQDPLILRRLRDLAETLPGQRKTVILIGPVLEMPVELERDIVFLELPLPEIDDLRPVLREVVAAQGNGSIKVKPDEEERLLRSCMGLTEPQARKLLQRALLDQDRITDDVLWSVISEKRQLLKGTELLEFWDVNEKLEDIGGLEWLKEWLERRTEAYTERARRYRLPQPKGILLFGVQGCGKSLTARVAARVFNFQLIRFDVSGVLSATRGSSEQRMRDVLKAVESVSPVVLWLDEIEKGFGGVSSGDDSAMTRVFGTFITWLQENRKPVFVIATANQVQNLPPELLRKGRFDELWFVDLPTIEERRSIFEIHLRKRGWDPARFDIESLAKNTDSFSGAEIEQIVLGAMYEAFGHHRVLRQNDLLDVQFATVPLSTTMEEQIDTLRHWASTRARPATPTSAVMEMIAEEAHSART
jgi:ATP-dependent 26S proteasome regulatory subunit